MQMSVMFGILMTMLSTETVTARQLAEKFELSQRSIYRYVSAISESGVPLVSKLGRNGGWSVMSNYKLRSIFFTKEEYDRMIFNTTTSSMSDILNSTVLDKLQGIQHSISDKCVLQSNQLVVDTKAGEDMQDKLSTMQQAIEGHRLLEIEYHSLVGHIGHRYVEPYSLVLKEGLWYVYCYCRLREGWRYFRISRIADIAVQNHGFLPRMFTVDLSQIEGFATAGKELVDVTMTVGSNSISAVEEWLGLGCMTASGDEYSVTTTQPYDNWLIDKIIGLGSGVVVVSPSRLRSDIAKRCQDIFANYK